MAKAAKEKTGESRTESGNPDISQQGDTDDPQEISQAKTQGEVDREWRCLTCSATAPSTASGYMSLIKHECTGKKEIRLIAIETGDELASNFKEAQSSGLLGKLKDDTSPIEKGDLSKGAARISSDNNIKVTITLPAIDLARFNIARRTSGSGEQESVLLRRHAAFPVKQQACCQVS